MASSPQANYPDLATAAYCRSWCQIVRIEGVAFYNYSINLTRPSGPLSRPTISQKIW
jgi:hypothetical protein